MIRVLIAAALLILGAAVFFGSGKRRPPSRHRQREKSSMGDPVVFDVMREHLGDREYKRGETREARAEEVKHLVDGGVLRRRDEAEAGGGRTDPAVADENVRGAFEKREDVDEDKSLGESPENKGSSRPSRRG
jgi:hypothetical protein